MKQVTWGENGSGGGANSSIEESKPFLMQNNETWQRDYDTIPGDKVQFVYGLTVPDDKELIVEGILIDLQEHFNK